MRGRPPLEPEQRKNPRSKPDRNWTQAPSRGWQHGDVPECPEGLMPASQNAWAVWLTAWFAAFWSPDDLPGLRTLIRVYDQVERGEFQRAAELRLQMDTYGITPKGQQDRRWKPAVEDEPGKLVGRISRYDHLRTVG